MIDRTSFTQFLSGRLLGLALLLGFQVAIVRLLSPPEYGLYAIAIAFAALVQTLTAFGIPRVVAKFVSGAGQTLSRRDAGRLAMALLALRFIACLLTLIVSASVFIAMGKTATPWPLIGAGASYTIATALQIDADGLAQALRLQIASRRAAVGEPLLRCLSVIAWVASGRLDAANVLWISAATSIIAAGALIVASFRRLSQVADPEPPCPGLDWRAVRGVAVGGYSGTLSWLAFSPAVIRLLASRVLSPTVFAGFSFAQALVVSTQRYMPSFTLFPLIEPAAMADAARTGQPDRLAAALSLLVKLDTVLAGAVIVGLAAAGTPILLVLTHGRYGDAAAFLPWLLAGIVANASHRSYEIAAVGLGVAEALTQALGLTMLWMILAVATSRWFGVWPLLACPLGDAVTRFWFVQRALTRRGAPDVIDRRGLGLILGAAVVTGFAGAAAAKATESSLLGGLAIGAVSASLFLLIVMRLRPIRPGEVTFLQAGTPWLFGFIARHRSKPERPLRVVVLTPRGRGGTGGVDRLMDSLRPLFAARRDLHVRFVTTRGPYRWASPLISAGAGFRLAAGAALGRIDVIHVNLGAHVGCYRKMALIAVPRLFKIPYVPHLHGSAFAAFWTDAPAFARRRIDALFRGAARIVVLGENWRALVEGRLPDVGVRIVVAPNATAPVERRRTGFEADVQVLFLGELGPRKGSTTLIEALGRLHARSNWRAVIAGDGDLAAARRRVEGLGLGGRVSLPGWVGPEGVTAFLAASDILVLPSLEENLPMSVIEAFGAGLAVIATPVGAVPDILTPGKTGLSVEPGNVDALAEALRVLIDQPALRHRLGAAAKAHHAQYLDLAPYADRLARLWAAAGRSSDTR